MDAELAVENAFVEYAQALRLDSPADQGSFLEGHPDLADRLAALFGRETLRIEVGAADVTRPLAETIAECLATFERDGKIDSEALVSHYPEQATTLRQFFGDPQRTERLATRLRTVLSDSPAPKQGQTIGDYVLLEEIAQGGMGVVYRARERRLDREVALKMIRSGRFASREAVRRFRAEAEAAGQLSHPNIVPIYTVGEHEGHHYFTMKLVDGGSLAQHVDRFGQDPRKAAQLMVEVGRAVRYAHQHGILHRDLKPANILIDAEGRPHVTDFGLAKRPGEEGGLTLSGAVVGTASYMSPEQAWGDSKRLNWAADVYSLGAILYELFTGRPPFHGATTHDTLSQVREREPESPRSLNPRVDRDLETICLKCLEKDPERRYVSALALIEDLERWLERRPIRARPIGPHLRGWRWCRRNPLAAMLILATAVLGTMAALYWREHAQMRQTEQRHMAQRAARRDEILRSSEYVARLTARVMRDRLGEFREKVRAAAEDPKLRALFTSGDREGMTAYAQTIDSRCRRPDGTSDFETWAILAADGTMQSHSHKPALLGVNFSYRDYHTGALRRAVTSPDAPVHVSRLYKAKADSLFKFGITCAARDADGTILGVVLASITTGPNMGLPEIEDASYKTVLVGRQDLSPAPGGSAPEEEFLVVLHPTYARGDPAHPYSGDQVAVLAGGRHPEYRDPLVSRSPDCDGPWLAGSAKIEGTDFVVIVQHRDQGERDRRPGGGKPAADRN